MDSLSERQIKIKSKSLGLLHKLDKYVQIHHQEIIGKFLTEFEVYCRKIAEMQEQGEKGEVAFIQLSVLRTNILAKRHKIRLDAYDENWYMDRIECSGEYDASEIYSVLDEYVDFIESQQKAVYSDGELERQQSMIFEESEKYFIFAAELARAGLKEASQKEWFNAFLRHEVFAVCIGGYHDWSDIIYKEDLSEKDPTDIKRHLSSEQRSHSHELCSGLNLSGGNYSGKCFSFSDFDNCDLSGSNFSGSKIINTSFKGAVLKKVDFGSTEMFNADFSGAQLENVSFDLAKIHLVSFKDARLKDVRFENALYINTLDFTGAELTGMQVPADKTETEDVG